MLKTGSVNELRSALIGFVKRVQYIMYGKFVSMNVKKGYVMAIGMEADDIINMLEGFSKLDRQTYVTFRDELVFIRDSVSYLYYAAKRDNYLEAEQYCYDIMDELDKLSEVN